MTRQPKDMADKNVPDASGVPGRRSRSENGYVDPESLIADLSKPQMFRMITYAFAIHIAIILVTSIGFISMCVKYHSMRPRQVVKTLEKEAAEKKMKEDAAKASVDAMKSAKAADEDARKNAKASPPANAAATQPPAGAAETSSEKPAEKKKSKIEQEIEKTSSERPTKSSVGLDITPDLE
jgi:uncharacterized membrane protein